VDVITTDNDEIEYVLCGINNDIAADDFVFVDAEVLLRCTPRTLETCMTI
jgi:hypothetical protein